MTEDDPMHPPPHPQRRAPRAALALGYAGLLPPLALVLLLLFRPRPEEFVLLFFYGALIFTFLGGVWWGLAIHAGRRLAPRYFVAGVVPTVLLVALAAFVALGVLLGGAAPLRVRTVAVLLGLAIGLSWLIDRQLVRDGAAPAWWVRLRLHLSLGLGGLLVAGALLAPA